MISIKTLSIFLLLASVALGQNLTKPLECIGVVPEECTVAEDCAPGDNIFTGSQCLPDPANEGGRKICICNPLTHVDHCTEKKCLLQLDDGDRVCEIDEQCTKIENAECRIDDGETERKCRCKDGFVSPFPTSPVGLHECLPVATTKNAPCSIALQCTTGMGPSSNCILGKCYCVNSTQFLDSDHTCYRPVELDGACQTHGECLVPHISYNQFAHCSEGKCACLPGTILKDRVCWQNKKIRDKCEIHEECQIPIGDNSECDRVSKDCQCQPEHVPDGDRKCASGFDRIRPMGVLNLLGVGLLLGLFYGKF